jgi:hypothetical protein
MSSHDNRRPVDDGFRARAVNSELRGAAIASSIYRSDRRLQISLFALMLLCYGTLLAISLRLARNDLMRLTFNSMLDHLMHGQFDVDPRIVGYEGYAYEGRIYAYWGILPALFRLPLWMAGRLDVDITVWSCFAAVCLAAMAKVRAVLVVRKSSLQDRAANWAIGLMLLYILFGGSEVGYLRISIYQEVILWAAAFGAVFVYFAIKGLVSREFDAITLSAMALCAGCSLLTRVSSGVGLVIAFALLLILVAMAPGAGEAKRPLFRQLAHSFTERRILFPIGILSAFVAAAGAVNYFRWGSPFTFVRYSGFCEGCSDKLTQVLTSGLYDFKRIPFGLVYYFFPVWVLHDKNGQLFFQNAQTQLVGGVEMPPSSFLLTDLLPLCFIAFLAVALWRRRGGGMSPMRQWAAAVAAGLLVPCMLMLTLIWMCYRYRMEFYPEIDFLALLGLYFIVTDKNLMTKFARVRRWMSVAVAVSILSSFIAITLYDLSYFGPSQESLRFGVVQFYSQSVVDHYHKVMSRHFPPH